MICGMPWGATGAGAWTSATGGAPGAGRTGGAEGAGAVQEASAKANRAGRSREYFTVGNVEGWARTLHASCQLPTAGGALEEMES